MVKGRPSLHTLIRMAARSLAVPAKTGTLLTLVDIAGIARRLGIPVTIRGTREWVLEELMRTAYDYGVLDKLCDEILSLIERRMARLRELAGDETMVELYGWVEEGYENTRKLLGMVKTVYVERAQQREKA